MSWRPPAGPPARAPSTGPAHAAAQCFRPPPIRLRNRRRRFSCSISGFQLMLSPYGSDPCSSRRCPVTTSTPIWTVILPDLFAIFAFWKCLGILNFIERRPTWTETLRLHSEIISFSRAVCWRTSSILLPSPVRRTSEKPYRRFESLSLQREKPANWTSALPAITARSFDSGSLA
jgi:hypothetical protein